MWQIDGGKDYVLTRGGLTDMQRAKAICMVETRFIVRSQQKP
jgi:hypothetical protein